MSDFSPLSDLRRFVEWSLYRLALLLILPVAVPLVWRTIRKLRERGAILDELFEKAPQAVAILTLDDTVIRVNQEFTQVFGYPPEETRGRPLSS